MKNGIVVWFLPLLVIIPGCGYKHTEIKEKEKKGENRSINGRIIARRMQKRIEDELIPRSLDKKYSAGDVQKIVHNEIGSMAGAQIKDILVEAGCLKIPHLINAIAKELVDTSELYAQELIGTPIDIPQELSIYLKKHMQLKKAGVEKEWSIADIIEHNEEMIVHDERGYSLTLQGKGVTSLYGIKHVQGIKYEGVPFDVAHIEHLYLRSNYILDHEHDPDFPEKPFEQFSQVQTLCLDENLLTCVPSTIFIGLDNLSHLYISGNRLTHIPEDVFHHLVYLDHLELSNNKLEELPEALFSGLHNLLWLGLNYNHVTNLPDDIFKGLNKLFLLEMAHNKLTSLPATIFQGLVKLEVLDLGHNQLMELPETIFQALPQLKNIDLIANQLTRLPETIFQVVNKFGNLRLGGNFLSEEQKNAICDFCSDKDCEVSLS